MNQLVKVTLATGLALSAMVGTTSSVTSNSTFIAHGSENIDYQVNGYTTDANDFILEPSFIEAVKNNNFVSHLKVLKDLIIDIIWEIT